MVIFLAKKVYQQNWFRLDNAGKIYPAIMSSKHSAVFRVSITLTEKIDPKILQKALDNTIIRCPLFNTRLKRGMFWYFLEKNKYYPKVEPDVKNPCSPILPRRNKGFLIKIRYYENRIALELFHALSDGSGALVFLKTLTARYLELKKGIHIPPGQGILDLNEEPKNEELEDSFAKYARLKKGSRKESKSYHIKGTKEKPGKLNIITGLIDASVVLKKAKEYNVSLTEFLASNYILALFDLQESENNLRKYPVKVSIPINLRSVYPSTTLRNFAHYINPGILPGYGEYSLDETISLVHHFLRYRLNEKFINAQICANVNDENNPVLKAAPLFLKNFVMGIVYKFVGESRFAATLSNLGNQSLPSEMSAFVKRMDFFLGPSRANYSNCGAIGYNNTLVLNFSRNIKETYAEQAFFTRLVKLGIPVKIESNNHD